MVCHCRYCRHRNSLKVSHTDHAKVSKFYPSTGRVAQKDILWFDISVDETKRVQVGQSTT